MVAKDGRSTATNCQHLCKRKYLFVSEGKNRRERGEREEGRKRERGGGEKEREVKIHTHTIILKGFTVRC